MGEQLHLAPLVAEGFLEPFEEGLIVGNEDAELLDPEPPMNVEPRVPLDHPKPDWDTQQKRNLTHADYQPWCEHCVAGHGRADAHRRDPARKDQDVAYVEADFAFLDRPGQEDSPTCILDLKDKRSGAIFAAMTQSKSSTDTYTVAAAAQ
eukprot:9848786-Alexandrium_andersonii.AAC.1